MKAIPNKTSHSQILEGVCQLLVKKNIYISHKKLMAVRYKMEVSTLENTKKY